MERRRTAHFFLFPKLCNCVGRAGPAISVPRIQGRMRHEAWRRNRSTPPPPLLLSKSWRNLPHRPRQIYKSLTFFSIYIYVRVLYSWAKERRKLLSAELVCPDLYISTTNVRLTFFLLQLPNVGYKRNYICIKHYQASLEAGAAEREDVRRKERKINLCGKKMRKELLVICSPSHTM